MKNFVKVIAASALAPSLVIPGVAYAEMLKFKAELSGQMETPATDSKAKGMADISVDTGAKKVAWKVTYDGLTGNPVAAHFHGPAKAGEKAGPVIDMSANIKDGSAALTDEQWKQLQDGMLYVNIHTEKFPDGEIRGQVDAVK